MWIQTENGRLVNLNLAGIVTVEPPSSHGCTYKLMACGRDDSVILSGTQAECAAARDALAALLVAQTLAKDGPGNAFADMLSACQLAQAELTRYKAKLGELGCESWIDVAKLEAALNGALGKAEGRS